MAEQDILVVGPQPCDTRGPARNVTRVRSLPASDPKFTAKSPTMLRSLLVTFGISVSRLVVRPEERTPLPPEKPTIEISAMVIGANRWQSATRGRPKIPKPHRCSFQRRRGRGTVRSLSRPRLSRVRALVKHRGVLSALAEPSTRSGVNASMYTMRHVCPLAVIGAFLESIVLHAQTTNPLDLLKEGAAPGERILVRGRGPSVRRASRAGRYGQPSAGHPRPGAAGRPGWAGIDSSRYCNPTRRRHSA